MKEWLKYQLGDTWRTRAHRLSRLRWILKCRLIRSAGEPATRHLRFILLDPEVGNFSYSVANVNDVLAAIADVTGVPLTRLEGYARELDGDPELHERLARHVRWRFDLKHRPPFGSRVGSYVLLRALRPGVVCETGIYAGLGSVVILRALERNRGDGAPGEILSFDASPHIGGYVDRARYPSWRPILGFTHETLEPAIADRCVGALIHDTDHDAETQSVEFGVALRHAATELLLIDCSGGMSPVLEQLSEEHGGVYRRVPITVAGHWYQPPPFCFALFRR